MHPLGGTRIRAVTLALAAIAALLSLAVALATVRAWREASAEAADLRRNGSELASRLLAAEQAAALAAARAEAASHLLLEKGIADEEELEAMRQLLESPAGGVAEPRRGQTLH